jgi:hypothetical protein
MRAYRTLGGTKREIAPETDRKGFGAVANILLALIGLFISVPAVGQDANDWITGLPREPIAVRAWPGEKKVAVCFVLYVEVWGFGHGQTFDRIPRRETRMLSMRRFVNTP